MTGIALSISDMDVDKQRVVMGALGAGARFGVLMPFSSKHESEADQIGLSYMPRASYDPRESIRFWKRMDETGGNQPPEFLSTYPSHACPKFVRQSLHEFAHASVRFCPWAKRFYQTQRARGKNHHGALRALAFKWIRILFRCWQNRCAYDPAKYAPANS